MIYSQLLLENSSQFNSKKDLFFFLAECVEHYANVKCGNQTKVLLENKEDFAEAFANLYEGIESAVKANPVHFIGLNEQQTRDNIRYFSKAAFTSMLNEAVTIVASEMLADDEDIEDGDESEFDEDFAEELDDDLEAELGLDKIDEEEETTLAKEENLAKDADSAIETNTPTEGKPDADIEDIMQDAKEKADTTCCCSKSKVLTESVQVPAKKTIGLRTKAY